MEGGRIVQMKEGGGLSTSLVVGENTEATVASCAQPYRTLEPFTADVILKALVVDEQKE